MYITDIEGFDIEEDIIIAIFVLDKEYYSSMNYNKVILRDPIDDIKISDVRFLNSTDRVDHKISDQYNFLTNDIKSFDVD